MCSKLFPLGLLVYSQETPATVRGQWTQEAPHPRLISGPLQRDSTQTLGTKDGHINSSCCFLTTAFTSSQQQHLSFPHQLDIVNHPVILKWPDELVSPTRSEGASSSCLAAPLQKLCLPHIQTTWVNDTSCLSKARFPQRYLHMFSLVHLSWWERSTLSAPKRSCHLEILSVTPATPAAFSDLVSSFIFLFPLLPCLNLLKPYKCEAQARCQDSALRDRSMYWKRQRV